MICYNWLTNSEFIDSKVYAQGNGQQRKRYVQFLSEEGREDDYSGLHRSNRGTHWAFALLIAFAVRVIAHVIAQIILADINRPVEAVNGAWV